MRVVYENEPFPASASEADFLRRLLGTKVETLPAGLRIVHVAGHLRLPDGSILSIRSRKAKAASLLAWLSYGDPALRALRTLGTLPGSAGEADFGPLVARMFCHETWRAVQASGLLRTYHRRQVRSATVRGRIDFPTLSRLGGDIARTPCVIFSRLPHTPLNSLLATAIDRVRRDACLRTAAGPTFAPLAAALSEVPTGVEDGLLSGRRVFSKLEQPFETCAALATLIVRGTGLGSGDYLGSPTFLIRLADLFESTVARAFRDSQLQVVPKHVLPVHRLSERGLTPHTPMEIDVFLPDVNGESVVVDAKYRRTISAGNLQQMATYCWLTGARRAVLVCPEGQITDRRSFLLPAGQGAVLPIRVDVVELRLSSTTLAGWRDAAAEVVESVRAARRAS